MISEHEISEYMTQTEFNEIKEFANGKQTPFLLLKLSKIEQKFDELVTSIPFAKVYFAVKACPIKEVILMLNKKGAHFDIASIYELDMLLDLGIDPKKMSFGNTIKKSSDIRYAFEKGIKLFATDSKSDLEKIAINAPGSKVFFRIISEGGNADWPLSKKFGAHPDMIFNLILESKDLNIIPYGISFHVGSQQRDIGQWDNAIAQTRYIFESVEEKGIKLKMINMGGGFPGTYLQPTQSMDVYTKEITRYLQEDFKDEFPEVIVEPGRSLTADAGVIVTEVVMISKKSKMAPVNWVYLDIGKFSGLIETMNESLKYPIVTTANSRKKTTEIIIAGPTCDSADILYEDFKYKMPNTLKEGDKLYILTTGAYTKSYSAINFNGFPPLEHYIIK